MGQPTITFISDLGDQSLSVVHWCMRLKAIMPDSRLISVTHNIAPFSVQEAAYVSYCTQYYTAPGTLHILLTDIQSAASAQLLWVVYEGQYFLIPDNGLMSYAFKKNAVSAYLIEELGTQVTLDAWLCAIERVLPWAHQEAVMTAKYHPIKAREMTKLYNTIIKDNGIDAAVLYVDVYGNVVLDVTAAELEMVFKGKPFVIALPGKSADITQVDMHPFKEEIGACACIVNEFGFLTITANKAHAATLLGWQAQGHIDIGNHFIAIRYA